MRLVLQSSLADKAGSKQQSQEPEEVVTGISLTTGLQLRSADDLQSPFTNYVRGFSSLLDFIWCELVSLQCVNM